jgi:large subunit ribosomal protein L35e
MARIKAKELREQDPEKLRQTLYDLRSELSKLRGGAQRGTLKKDIGHIRRIRRDVAVVLTVLHEKGVAE